MARDIRAGTRGRRRRPPPKPVATLWQRPMVLKPPKPTPPPRRPQPARFQIPGAPGGLRIQRTPPPRRRVQPKLQAAKRTPIKAPVRAVRGTSSTIPPHARTPAQKSTSISDRTPAAKARAPYRPARPTARRPAATQVVDPGFDMPELTDQDLVQQQLAPLYLENDQALQAEQQFEQQRAALIQSLTGQLMGKLGGIAPQVAQDYNSFIATNTGLAQEAQQALAAASTNPQIQADMAAVNAPQEQRDQLATQAQQVFQGGGAVLFTGQGMVPGQELSARGAAETAYARQLPAIAGLQGQQNLAAFLQQAMQQRQQIANQRALIAAKAPGILQEIMSSRASEAAKQRALDLEEAALRRQLGNDVFNRGVTKTKLGFEKTRLTQAQKRLNIQALTADRNWQATLQRLQISQTAEKRKATELELKARRGGYTPSQLAKMRGTAYTIADHAFHGFTETNSKGEVTATHRKLSYGEAIREMLKEGIPLRLATPALNFYYQPNQRRGTQPTGTFFGANPFGVAPR